MVCRFCCRATLALVLVRIAIALPMGAQEPADKSSSAIQAHFDAALRDQHSGSLDAAASEYREVIHLDPRLAEAYANLGLIYYAQSKFQESADALGTATRLSPGMEGVMLWLGVDDIKLGKAGRAVPLLRYAVARNPSDRQAQKWLGTALWDSGDPFAALDQLEKVSRLFPSDQDSWFALGEAYRKEANRQIESLLVSAQGTPLLHQVYGDIYKDQHLWIRAAQHYRKASQEDQKWKGAHLGLAEVDLAQNKLDDAKAELQQELAIDPSSVGAMAYLAEVALLSGNAREALRLLQDAIRTSPYGTSISLGLPAPHEGLETTRTDEGSASLQKALTGLRLAPSSAARDLALAIIDKRLALPQFSKDFANYEEAIGNIQLPQDPYLRALADFRRGRLKPAESILSLHIKTAPNDSKARYLLAKALKGLSLQTLDKLIAIDPDSARVHQLLGQIYEDRDDSDKALAEYRIVEKMEPSLPGIHYEIGHLLWLFGDRANALVELHQELKLNPVHAEANGEIGSILIIQGKPDKAIPYLESALRIDPGLFFIHRQLGTAYLLQKKYPEAEQELKIAARNDMNGSAHYQLGMAYRAEGKTEEATRAIKISGNIRAELLASEQHAAPGASLP